MDLSQHGPSGIKEFFAILCKPRIMRARVIFDGREGPRSRRAALYPIRTVRHRILDISAEVSFINRKRKKDVYVSVDMDHLGPASSLKLSCVEETAKWPSQDMLTAE